MAPLEIKSAADAKWDCVSFGEVMLRFDPGSGNDRVVTHDFWEEIYIISGTLDCGGRPYPAGSVAVRPPGMPHGPFHSAAGCVSFEVRYRAR